MNDFLKSHTANSVAQMSAYTPGEQPSDSEWVKLNTNEFPYPPSPKVRQAILDEIGEDCSSLRLYPDPISSKLRRELGNFFGVSEECVIAGNGSDDILNLVIRAFSDSSKSIVTLDPSYSLYPVLAKIQGSKIEELSFDENLKIPFDKIFSSSANIFFFTNPNAPTGIGFPIEVVERIVSNFKGLVLVDEAYAPFADYSSTQLVDKYPNLIVTGTSSKGWGLAGMRVGWGIANPEIIDILDRVRDSYNLDRLSQVAGTAAISDSQYHLACCNKIKENRKEFEAFLDSINWKYNKSSANFVLVQPTDKSGNTGKNVASDFFDFLKSRKILVRFFPNCLPVCDSLRISIGTKEQMTIVKNAVKEWLNL